MENNFQNKTSAHVFTKVSTHPFIEHSCLLINVVKVSLLLYSGIFPENETVKKCLQKTLKKYQKWNAFHL